MLHSQGFAVSALLSHRGGPSVCGTENQAMSWVLPPIIQGGEVTPAPCVRAGSGCTPSFPNSPSGPKSDFQAGWIDSLCARLVRTWHRCPSLVCAHSASSTYRDSLSYLCLLLLLVGIFCLVFFFFLSFFFLI